MVNLFGIMYNKSVVRIQVNDTEPTQRISVFRPCWCSYSEYEPASSQEQRLRSVPPRLQLRRKSCAAVEVQILCLGLHQKSCPWEARARARAPPWPIELVECYRGSAPQRRLQIRPPRHLLDGRHRSLGTAAFLCFQYVEFRCPRNLTTSAEPTSCCKQLVTKPSAAMTRGFLLATRQQGRLSQRWPFARGARTVKLREPLGSTR